ncbi:hypothetical protein CMEL01_03588 [Colletotrichum melonis]|uniref:Integral membrane protein n=1 Tax=Colletotrichum melonis TaxID=1209925 RepID=A0AAI9UAK8_9PEZI|nr:hypothetical protein CMEL01_03588 [Colletotrichum melonis]
MAAQRSQTQDCDPEIQSGVCFGIVIGLTILNFGKVTEQTLHIYSRTKSFANMYSWMVWILLFTTATSAVITWFFVRGQIAGSSTLFLSLSTVLWVLLMQIPPQIVANRLGLIMANKKTVKAMKITLLVLISIMNVLCIGLYIWARRTYPILGLHVQKYAVPIASAFSASIDLFMNSVFLRKVHRELITNGLVKYRLLFRLNVAAIIVLLSMEAVLTIIVLVLPTSFLYTSIQPAVYSIKLAIELMMADLIARVVQEQHQMQEI